MAGSRRTSKDGEIRAHITQAAKQWEERDRELAELYRGTRLSITLDWAARHGRELNELEREFLSKSREASEQEAEKQRKTNRRLRGLLVGTAIFLAVALVAGSLALVQRSRARNAQAAAEAEALRSDAQRIGTLAQTEPNLDRSLLLAVAGVQLNDLPETRGDLLAVLQKTPDVFRLTRVSRNELTAIAVSPDGRLLASGDSAGEVRFNDLLTWKSSGARCDSTDTSPSRRWPSPRTVACWPWPRRRAGRSTCSWSTWPPGHRSRSGPGPRSPRPRGP